MSELEREPDTTDEPHHSLIAYTSAGPPPISLTPAPRWRDWMNATEDRWANRCLPLLMANECGWTLLNPTAFTVTWTGEESSGGLSIEFDGGVPPRQVFVDSNFGYGVLTFRVPYLFRTSPGWNLLARGPANWPKDGICALEGLVETDWTTSTFTMNWKLTRADHPVRFEADEPFCMVVPQRRGDLESFAPELRAIYTDREAYEGSQLMARRRHELQVRKFLGRYSTDFDDARYEWERDYFKGLRSDGTKAEEHQTQLRLPPFVDRSGSD
jgi:hypothetical protein